MSTTADAPLSRRRILGRLSAAAVGGGALAATGVVGGGTARADNGDSLILGTTNVQSDTTRLLAFSQPTVSGLEVLAKADAFAVRGESHYIGVWGESSNYNGFDNSRGEHVGVWGQATNTCGHDRIGVRGEALDGPGTGVEGLAIPFGYGVRGFSGRGFGVRGEVTHLDGVGVSGTGPGVGVKGEGEIGVLGVGPAGETGVKGDAAGTGWGVWGTTETGHGVHGDAGSGAVGVFGRAVPYGYGVRGVSAVGYGIHGEATNGGIGVQGISDVSAGVRGDSTGGPGVRGESQTDVGVYGRSVQHTGVTGYGGTFGVVGQCDAGGTAVDATSSNGGTGVWGRSLPTGYGVRGESASGFGVRGEATTGIGLSGSSTQGTAISGKGRLGGEFQGTRAAVRLVPTGFVGPPASGTHARGELVCDKNGDLWFCKATGVPGTWAQLA